MLAHVITNTSRTSAWLIERRGRVLYLDGVHGDIPNDGALDAVIAAESGSVPIVFQHCRVVLSDSRSGELTLLAWSVDE